MKGSINQLRHPIAHVCFFYLLGCSIGQVLASVVLFYQYYYDPTVNMALAATFMIIATLIAVTWGEK